MRNGKQMLYYVTFITTQGQKYLTDKIFDF